MYNIGKKPVKIDRLPQISLWRYITLKNALKTARKVLTNEYVILGAILLLSLVLRLYYLFNTTHPPIAYDAYNYDIMARQFLEKGFLGYRSSTPNAYTTPGYPLFLALLYKIFGYANGSPLTGVRVVQIILSTLTIYLLYLTAKLISGKRAALLSAFFFSIYLIGMWVPTLILTETLYTFLFMLYLYIQIIAINKKSFHMNFIAGVILALAVLVRPLIAPLMILPYAYYYFKDKAKDKAKDKFYIKGFLLNAAGFTIIMLPWWIRNFVLFNKIILFATQADPLLRGTYPYDIGISEMPLINQKEEAIRRIKEGFTKQPLYYLKWYTLGKFDYLFFKLYYYVDEKVTLFASLLPIHYLYVWLGWIGVVFASINKNIRLIALYIILITMANLVFVATSRYSYPIMPLLIMLSAAVIDVLWKKEIN